MGDRIVIANPILLQRKSSRVIEEFAKRTNITLDEALDFFYKSHEYELLRQGIADLHCMSDGYIAEDLCIEYDEGNGKH